MICNREKNQDPKNKNLIKDPKYKNQDPNKLEIVNHNIQKWACRCEFLIFRFGCYLVLGTWFLRFIFALVYNLTVTRKNVAAIDVVSFFPLLFCLSNNSTSSCCNASAFPFFSAASNAFIVGP